MRRGFYTKKPQDAEPYFVVHPKVLRMLRAHPRRRLRAMVDIADPVFGKYDLWAIRRLESHLALKKVKTCRSRYKRMKKKNAIGGVIFDEILFMEDFEEREGTLVTMRPRPGYDRVVDMRQHI